MKITEAARRRTAWEVVEEVATHAESLNPKRDWEESHDAVVAIYQIAHSIRTPKCRKNHPKWIDRVNAAVRDSRRKR